MYVFIRYQAEHLTTTVPIIISPFWKSEPGIHFSSILMWLAKLLRLSCSVTDYSLSSVLHKGLVGHKLVLNALRTFTASRGEVQTIIF